MKYLRFFLFMFTINSAYANFSCEYDSYAFSHDEKKLYTSVCGDGLDGSAYYKCGIGILDIATGKTKKIKSNHIDFGYEGDNKKFILNVIEASRQDDIIYFTAFAHFDNDIFIENVYRFDINSHKAELLFSANTNIGSLIESPELGNKLYINVYNHFSSKNKTTYPKNVIIKLDPNNPKDSQEVILDDLTSKSLLAIDRERAYVWMVFKPEHIHYENAYYTRLPIDEVNELNKLTINGQSIEFFSLNISNSQRVVYSTRSSDYKTIKLYLNENGNVEQIHELNHFMFPPAISKRGNKLVFIAEDDSGFQKFHIMDLNTRKIQSFLKNQVYMNCSNIY